MTAATDAALEARRLRTVVWVVALATVGLIFSVADDGLEADLFTAVPELVSLL
jgi:hypothetical protein